jgi:signal transduction histidine kinase
MREAGLRLTQPDEVSSLARAMAVNRNRPYRLIMDFAWRPPAVDVMLATGLVFAFSEPGFDPYHHASGALWAATGVLAAAAVAWRRLYPQPVWLLSTAATVLVLVTRRGPDWAGLSPLVLMPAALVALYSLASRAPRRTGQLATAASGIALECGLLTHLSRVETVGTTAALVAVAWAIGESAKARDDALEAERAARAARAAADERARIARELHDIVAHHVSVVSLQAGTARLLAESGAPPDTALLAGIETASRQAMTELRHALGVIKHTPGGAEPQPGLSRLAELTADCGVAVTVDGDAGALPASADLIAYRVIQEGLTNVLRHSAATAASVTLRRYPDSLHITVADEGPARAAQLRSGRSGGGQGLAGLRERVAAQHGMFRAGPRSGATGFEVHAEIPVPV